MREFFDVESGDIFVHRYASIVSLVIKTTTSQSCSLSLDTRESGEVVVCYAHYMYSKNDDWKKLV